MIASGGYFLLQEIEVFRSLGLTKEQREEINLLRRQLRDNILGSDVAIAKASSMY